VQRLKNSLEEFRVPRSSGGTTFSYVHERTQVKEFAEEKEKTKVEAFGELEFFQVQEESAEAQEGAQ
jgi:hypothetical protein